VAKRDRLARGPRAYKQSRSRGRGSKAIDELAAGIVYGLLALGSLALWTGIPAGALFAAAKLSTTKGGQLAAALPLTLAGMVMWGVGLMWLNGLYLRIQCSGQDESQAPPVVRGPLERLLVLSLGIAFVAFLVWFFAFATNPGPGISI
jgi:hypothetical protein